MNLSEPNEILVNFLRYRVSEVTRVGLSDRQTTDSQSFSGDGVETEFTLTDTPVAINSVSVGGTDQSMYLDYNIDLDNKKITFLTAPASGTNNIIINYEKGSNWIFPDKPRDVLKRTKYPRISVVTITEGGVNQSMDGDNSFDTIVFQIDVLAYKDQNCTISSETKEGQDVVDYLARQVTTAIKSNWRTDLKNKLMRPVILNNFPAPFEPDKNIFRRIIEVQFEAFNIGE